jgi:hypothetical protein
MYLEHTLILKNILPKKEKLWVEEILQVWCQIWPIPHPPPWDFTLQIVIFFKVWNIIYPKFLEVSVLHLLKTLPFFLRGGNGRMGEWFYLLFQIGVLFFNFVILKIQQIFPYKLGNSVEFILGKRILKFSQFFIRKKTKKKFWGKKHWRQVERSSMWSRSGVPRKRVGKEMVSMKKDIT